MKEIRLLVINGSLSGSTGNTGIALNRLSKLLAQDADLDCLHLAEHFPTKGEIESLLQSADGLIFSSGTYWDSWGSPLQRFLETLTDLEGTDAWLGKPAICLVTMHSVGGKEVLSRLQGVLSTLGLLTPPMSGIVLSLANQLAAQTPNDFADDFWQLADLEILAQNLLEAVRIRKEHRPAWKAWTVDRKNPSRRWIS